MSTIAKKLEYLWGTKLRIALAIKSKGVQVSPKEPFIDYADKILDIYGNYTGIKLDDPAPGDDTVRGKLSYLAEAKERIGVALLAKGVLVPAGTPFRDYPSYVLQIVNTGSGLVDYNGVMLPDVSPHITDQYPKAAILELTGSVYYQLVVIGGEWEFVTDTDSISTSPESISITYQAKEGDTAWTKVTEDNATHTGTVELVDSLHSVLWSNFDIPELDGEGEGGEGGGTEGGGTEGGGTEGGGTGGETGGLQGNDDPTVAVPDVGYVWCLGKPVPVYRDVFAHDLLQSTRFYITELPSFSATDYSGLVPWSSSVAQRLEVKSEADYLDIMRKGAFEHTGDFPVLALIRRTDAPEYSPYGFHFDNGKSWLTNLYDGKTEGGEPRYFDITLGGKTYSNGYDNRVEIYIRLPHETGLTHHGMYYMEDRNGANITVDNIGDYLVLTPTPVKE